MRLISLVAARDKIDAPLLRSLPQAVLERVLAAAGERRFAPGEIMLVAGMIGGAR